MRSAHQSGGRGREQEQEQEQSSAGRSGAAVSPVGLISPTGRRDTTIDPLPPLKDSSASSRLLVCLAMESWKLTGFQEAGIVN